MIKYLSNEGFEQNKSALYTKGCNTDAKRGFVATNSFQRILRENENSEMAPKSVFVAVSWLTRRSPYRSAMFSS